MEQGRHGRSASGLLHMTRAPAAQGVAAGRYPPGSLQRLSASLACLSARRILKGNKARVCGGLAGPHASDRFMASDAHPPNPNRGGTKWDRSVQADPSGSGPVGRKRPRKSRETCNGIRRRSRPVLASPVLGVTTMIPSHAGSRRWLACMAGQLQR